MPIFILYQFREANFKDYFSHIFLERKRVFAPRSKFANTPANEIGITHNTNIITSFKNKSTMVIPVFSFIRIKE